MTETTDEKYAKHLDAHRASPALRRVLLKETTFVQEIRRFYDMERGSPTPGTPLPPDRMLKPDEKKNGETPTELSDLLEPFGETDLDRSRLQYDRVREAYAWQEDKDNFILKVGVLPVAWGLVGASIIATKYFLPENTSSDVPVMIDYAGLFVTFAGALISMYSSAKTKYPATPEQKSEHRKSLEEFYSLCRRAATANECIDNSYRNQLLCRAVEQAS